MKKTIIKISLILCISVLLVGCKKDNKDDTNKTVDKSNETENVLETNDKKEPVIITTTEPEPTIIPKEKDTSINNQDENSELDVDKEDTNAVKIEKYQKLTNENDILKKFLESTSYLQSQHLKNLYKELTTGDKKEDVIKAITASNLRHIDDVTLDYLYDETGLLLDMEDRKGLMVFTHSNDLLEKELETLKAGYSEEIIIDANKPNYDSYVVFIFNKDDLLVGKFKSLVSENLNFTFDETTLDGSLSFGSYNLSIALESDVLALYEKMDAVRIIIDENQNNLNKIIEKLDLDFKEFYDAIVNDYNTNQLITKVSEYEFGIEKMNSFNLNKINDRFIKDFTEGYYIFLNKNEAESSIDLRYNNYYIGVVFDNSNKFYYKSIVNDLIFVENGIDIKDTNNYTLEEIKKNIKVFEEEVSKFKKEKTNFTNYLDENIGLLNNNIKYSMDYSSILSEIKLSGLDYYDDYKNLTITTFRNKVGGTVSVNDEYDQPKYDNVIQVKGGTKDIYLFFKENELIGIYRSLYFDISDVAISDYRNLIAIKKGLTNLNKALMEKESELKVYKTLLEQKEELLKIENKNK